ncbi:hypothetical protein FOBRF1_014469 [Fusarium oxysporum]
MKAIQIKEFGSPYTVSEVDKPKPKPNQLLVQIKSGGFCHTDCMALENAFGSKLPFIGSHEPAGVVVEVGSDVHGFAEGDRAGCLNFDRCCMTLDLPSNFQTHSSFPLQHAAACMMCAGITVYGGIKGAKVPSGGSIGIVGIGGLGHIGTQVAKSMGYKVAAIDVKQDALDLVASYNLKPDVCILSTDLAETSMEKITNIIKGDYPGLDATIIATDAPAAFDLAAKLTRKHGTMVLGQPEKGITMSYQNVIFRDINLIRSLVADTDEKRTVELGSEA